MATQVSLTDGAVASAGALAIQTNGTTQAVSISTGQVATLAQNPILTSGTANGVAYLNGSKAVTSGSALTFDGTNFATTGTASATKMIPTGGSATGNGMYLPASNTLAWSNNGSETMRLDSAGNLGLGVTPSAWNSTIKAAQFALGGSIAGATNTSNIALNSNAYLNSAGSAYVYINSDYATRYLQQGGVHYWYNAASGTAGNAITFTQAMTLDASGNLGVGTTSPNQKLHVSGGTINSGGSAGLYYQGGSWDILKNTSGNILAFGGFTASQWDTLTFSTSGSERARIDSSGNLLVGTTSASTAPATGFTFNPQTSGAYAAIGHTTSAGNGAYFVSFGYNGGVIGTITQNGTTAVAYNTSSDYRLKNTIAPMTGALARVAALKPVTYKWNADGSDGEGFIAHELAEVCPHAVTGEKDAVDADGNPQYQGIDTSFLVATLTAAIKEQQALITQLTARITALESA